MLRPEVIEAVKNSRQAITRLMLQNNCGERTIQNWLKANSDKLTTFNNLAVISVALQIPQSNLVEAAQVTE